MNVADFIVIGIILLAGIIGLYKGLLNTLYKLITYILSVYLAFKLAKPVSGWFKGTSIYIKLQDGIADFVGNLGLNFDNIENITPEAISNSIKDIPIPETINKSIADNVASIGGNANTMLESFVIVITDLVLLIICGFVLFIILKLLFSLFGHVIKGISEIPIIKQIDRIGGGVLGMGIGVVVVLILGILLAFFISKEAWQPMYVLIDDSMIASYLYHNNILAGLLGL